MRRKRIALREELLAEYLRHHLAHAQQIDAGWGQRGCQFCPTLKVRPGAPRRGFLRPGLFPQRFYRDLTRDVNRIKRMAMGGHREAGRFMEFLRNFLKGRPWNGPPSSPAAVLPAPEETEGVLKGRLG